MLSLILSVFFCIYSLYLLDLSKYNVFYEYKNETLDEDLLDYRFCIDFKHIYTDYLKNPVHKERPFKKAKVNLVDIKIDLHRFLEQAEEEWGLESKFSKLFKNDIESDNFFIFKDKICLPFPFIKLFNPSNEEFLFDFYNLEREYSHLFWNETFTLLEFGLSFSRLNTKRFIILKKPHPYSNCKATELNTNETYSKSRCLNDCYRRYANLSKYFYEPYENVTIQINYKNSKSIIANEKYCLTTECKEDDCRLAYSESNVLAVGKESSQLSYYIARPIISDLDYYIELFGLILLFIDVSLYHLVSYAFEFVLNKIFRSTKVIFTFELVWILFCSTFALHLINEVASVYVTKSTNSTRTQLISSGALGLNQEPVVFVLCFEFDAFNIFRNRTFLQIENELDKKFRNIFEGIRFEFRNKFKKLKLRPSSKVLFKFEYKHYRKNRCFQVQLDPMQPIYKDLLSVSRLSFTFRNLPTLNAAYLLPNGRNFNSKSYRIRSQHDFLKYKIKRFNRKNQKCIDYSSLDNDGLKCVDQFDCVDKCLQKKLFEKDSMILDESVIDKEQFSEDDWSTRVIKGVIKRENVSSEIENECTSMFMIEDCEEVYFENSGVENHYEHSNEIQINLNYETVSVLEEEPSKIKLSLDLLAIASIIFGLNIFRFLVSIFSMFNIKKNSYVKVRAFPFVACAIGSLIHLFLIFKGIINEDLIKSQSYEEQRSVEMPNVVLCFEHRANLSGNLNYDTLNNLTEKLSFEKTFENIFYLDQLNNWIPLDDQFDVDVFYFLDSKCFNLKFSGLVYKREQFAFQSNRVVLKANFYLGEGVGGRVMVLTKKKDALRLNKITYIDYFPSTMFTIREEKFETFHYDQYSLVKNLLERPLSLFNQVNHLNDADKYLNDLMKNYKEEYNLTTLNVPLESDDNLMINDEHFEDYIKNVQDRKDASIAPYLNYERESTIHHLDSKVYQDINVKPSNFQFEITFFKRVVIETNENTYSKLILSLLNVISLWLGSNPLSFFVFKTSLLNKVISKYLLRKKYDSGHSNHLKASRTLKWKSQKIKRNKVSHKSLSKKFNTI